LIAFKPHTEDAVTQVAIIAAAAAHNQAVANHVHTESHINHAVCNNTGNLSNLFHSLYIRHF
jgi:hypothetical protein